MENASKALIMAAGILIGVLILALMVTLFVSSKETFDSYEERKQAEAIQQFNVNFTKYLGQELSIHQVVSICNFANKNGVNIISGEKNAEDIKDIVDNYSDFEEIPRYRLTINSFSDEGYVNSISFD